MHFCNCTFPLKEKKNEKKKGRPNLAKTLSIHQSIHTIRRISPLPLSQEKTDRSHISHNIRHLHSISFFSYFLFLSTFLIHLLKLFLSQILIQRPELSLSVLLCYLSIPFPVSLSLSQSFYAHAHEGSHCWTVDRVVASNIRSLVHQSGQ